MDEFLTIEKEETVELEEKKSKFFADSFYIESEEKVKDIIWQLKKRYKGAKHNCYAYRIIENNRIIEKSYDDGEPVRNSRRTNIKQYNK